MSAILSAQDIVKIYEGRRVLDRVSLRVGPGQRLGLIGENGAGKTTLLRVLAGLVEPDDGQVHRPADTGLLHRSHRSARTPRSGRWSTVPWHSSGRQSAAWTTWPNGCAPTRTTP